MRDEPHLKLATTDAEDLIDLIGEDHVATNFNTPLRTDAFELDDDLKIELIEKHFKEIKRRLVCHFINLKA
jgi:GTP cyclohydrolase I